MDYPLLQRCVGMRATGWAAFWLEEEHRYAGFTWFCGLPLTRIRALGSWPFVLFFLTSSSE